MRIKGTKRETPLVSQQVNQTPKIKIKTKGVVQRNEGRDPSC